MKNSAPPPGYEPVHRLIPVLCATGWPSPETVQTWIDEGLVRSVTVGTERWLHVSDTAKLVRQGRKRHGRRSIILTSEAMHELARVWNTHRGIGLRQLAIRPLNTTIGPRKLSITRLRIYLRLMGIETSQSKKRQSSPQPNISRKFLDIRTPRQWRRAILRKDVRDSVRAYANRCNLSIQDALIDLKAPADVVRRFANASEL